MLKTNKGFTLMEVMLSVLIFSFILGGFYSVLVGGNKSFSLDSNYVDLQQQVRKSVDRMVRELRGALDSSIVVTTVVTANDKITFNTASATGIKYYLNGSQQLIREYPSGTTKIMAVNITYLKFVKNGSLLQIDLTAEKNFFKLLSVPYHGQVVLRSG